MNRNTQLKTPADTHRVPLVLIVIYATVLIFGGWYYLTNSGSGKSLPQNQEISAAARGKQVAAQKGCFACHGPEGKGGIENPTHKDNVVPGWNSPDLAGNNMFYPIIMRQEIEHAVIRTMYDDPTDIGGQEYAPFKMQPWLGRLTSSQIRDIMAYIYSINPTLQQKMVEILGHQQDPDIPPFADVSGDINPAFPRDADQPAVTKAHLPMGTPAVQQMPGGNNYPDTYQSYLDQNSEQQPPQYYQDVKDFADLINLKY